MPSPVSIRRALAAFALLAVAALSAWPSPSRAQAAAAAAAEDPAGARVIVKYRTLGPLMRALRAGVARGPQFAATLGPRVHMALRDGRIVDARTQVVHGDRALGSAALAARLAADPDVEYAVPDLRRRALAVPKDPLYAASAAISPPAGQWYLRPPDATFPSAIDAEGAWDITPGLSSIVVADVDTGVRFEHPDLASKLLPGYDFVSTAGGGPYTDPDASDPGDWSTRADICGAAPSSWHGTQTAGLIGAQTGNGIGMASAGHDVMVLPVRVLGRCGGFDSDIIAGMLWAGGVSANPVANPHPARVLNLSLGGSGGCTAAYADAVRQLTAAGVVVVAAAGNEEGLAVDTPANCSGVIAVAGLRHAGTKVGFSSIGPQVAIAAPGGNCINTSGACLYPILTTTNSGTTTPLASTYTDSADSSLGTSFATPLVTGTVALMLSVNPSLTPVQVKSLLQGSARPFPVNSAVATCHAPNRQAQDECNCTTSTCGAGMLDAAAAVRSAAVLAAPIARIAASATNVGAGASVVFDGTASSAPSGRSIAAYRWAITGGAALAAFSSGTDGPTATVKTLPADPTATFTVQLTVTDSAGVSATQSLAVTVNEAAAPTARIVVSDGTVAAGASVTFDASGSAAAPALSITAYQWTISAGSGLAAFTSSTNAASAVVATAAAGSGDFTVQLKVTDSAGRQGSASSTVHVTAVQPVAVIDLPSASVDAGSSLTLDGSGSSVPAPRSLVGYRWAITDGAALAHLSGSTTAPTATLVTSGAGSVTVQLTVTDSAGVSASTRATVTVQAAPAVAVSSGSGGTGTGSGGGAMSPVWLGLLALAVGMLRRRPH